MSETKARALRGELIYFPGSKCPELPRFYTEFVKKVRLAVSAGELTPVESERLLRNADDMRQFGAKSETYQQMKSVGEVSVLR